MSSLHTEPEAQEEFQTMSRRNDSEQDREISLNTSTILLIFFALALVCSAFFGFGYTMGRKTAGPASFAAAEDHTQSLSEAFKSFKPAPGGPSAKKSSAAPAPEPTTESTADEPDSSKSIVVATPAAKSTPPPAAKKAFDPDAEIVTAAPAPKSVPVVHTAPPIAPAVAQPTVSTNPIIVQVAAVSHQEDADVMLSALKRKGYSVSIRQEPQDRLLHLQLGPYATKKDAEAMRTRLLADGYNSILK